MVLEPQHIGKVSDGSDYSEMSHARVRKQGMLISNAHPYTR